MSFYHIKTPLQMKILHTYNYLGMQVCLGMQRSPCGGGGRRRFWSVSRAQNDSRWARGTSGLLARRRRSVLREERAVDQTERRRSEENFLGT